MKIREYRGLFVVFVAAAIGISLLCSVSGMAIQDLNESTTGVDLQPAEIVGAAVSNLNTAGALTKQAFVELIPTSTATLRPTIASTPSSVAPLTVTAFQLPTLSGPTATRRPRRYPTNTPVPPPTRTPTDIPPPTRTPLPTWTNSPAPTDTLPPLPTNTTEPPPTDTTEPPPTDTLEPPTDTLEPPVVGGPPVVETTPTP